MEKEYHAKTNQNKSVVVIIISELVDFKAMNMIWDKEGHDKGVNLS